LPVGPTGYGNSPYQSLSSFAGNGLLISPEYLISDGLLNTSDCAPHFPSDLVDYDSVIPFAQFPVQLDLPATAGALEDMPHHLRGPVGRELLVEPSDQFV